jgi:NAD(P)-dependent dehydrogenase (short-subunit alcohol dehydrogenase family)
LKKTNWKIFSANQFIRFEKAPKASCSLLQITTLSSAVRILIKGWSLIQSGKLLIKGGLAVMQIDFTDDASADAAAREITDNFGRLDILANNAGIGWCTNSSAWDAMTQLPVISVAGMVSVNEAFLPLLRIYTLQDWFSFL